MTDKNKHTKTKDTKESAKKIFNVAGLLDLPEDEQDKIIDAMLDKVLGPDEPAQVVDKTKRKNNTHLN
jgi:hypothetical protein